MPKLALTLAHKILNLTDLQEKLGLCRFTHPIVPLEYGIGMDYLDTHILPGEVHRLANPGTIPLEIIEVQPGDNWGEDDIVPIEDHYGHSQA